MNSLKKIGMAVFLFTLLILPVVGLAQLNNSGAPGSSGNSERLLNPISGNVQTLEQLVVLVLKKVVIPVGSIVIVFMIIYTGFKFVMARGNPDAISDARRMLLYVLIGAAILLGSTVIAGAISGTLCDIVPNLPNCRVGPYQQDGSF